MIPEEYLNDIKYHVTGGRPHNWQHFYDGMLRSYNYIYNTQDGEPLRNPLWNLVLMFPDKPWDWTILSLNTSIDLYIVISNPGLPWDWNAIYCRIYSKSDNNDDQYLQYSPVDWEEVAANPDKDWNWSNISSNPAITWDIVQSYLYMPWVWHELSKNPNITWEIIKNNPDKPWDWQALSGRIFKK